MAANEVKLSIQRDTTGRQCAALTIPEAFREVNERSELTIRGLWSKRIFGMAANEVKLSIQRDTTG